MAWDLAKHRTGLLFCMARKAEGDDGAASPRAPKARARAPKAKANAEQQEAGADEGIKEDRDAVKAPPDEDVGEAGL